MAQPSQSCRAESCSGQWLHNQRLFKYSVQQVIKCSRNKLVVAQDGDLGAGTYMNLAELATCPDGPRAKGNRAQIHSLRHGFDDKWT